MILVTGMVGYHERILGVFDCIFHNYGYKPEVMDGLLLALSYNNQT